jgi:CheY-like chemotaxis protein
MNAPKAVEILIVEDTPQDLELALRALRKAKLTNNIQVARDGAEALEFIFGDGVHAGRKLEYGPNVILLDLKLPKVDGLDVLKRIKSDPRTKGIPVVVLTSSKGAKRCGGKLQTGRQQLHCETGEFRTIRGGRAGIGHVLAAAQPRAQIEPLSLLIGEAGIQRSRLHSQTKCCSSPGGRTGRYCRISWRYS